MPIYQSPAAVSDGAYLNLIRGNKNSALVQPAAIYLGDVFTTNLNMISQLASLCLLNLVYADEWWATGAPSEYQCALEFVPRDLLNHASDYTQVFLNSLTKENPDYWGDYYGGASYDARCHGATTTGSVNTQTGGDTTTTITNTDEVTFTISHSTESTLFPSPDDLITTIVATQPVTYTIRQTSSEETRSAAQTINTTTQSVAETPAATTSAESEAAVSASPATEVSPTAAASSPAASAESNPFGSNPFGSNPFGSNPFGSNPFGTAAKRQAREYPRSISLE